MSFLVIRAIRFYQRFLRSMVLPCCRYYPSCSEYSISALKKYGLFKGSFLGLKRLLRCHPFSSGGYNPLE